MTSLNEAVAIEREELKGRKTVYEIQPVKKYDNTEIKQIRTSVGMTQLLFAKYMGVSSKTNDLSRLTSCLFIRGDVFFVLSLFLICGIRVLKQCSGLQIFDLPCLSKNNL